ncbi:neuraminidase-like domain-containing protein [Pseudomonas sp. NPDC088368]|uniref:Tc toxin subunit A-related protein n=1 Tax=Pseudomonas sp. NPDC088368 TaxID=3364453 RepID=UPI00380F5CF0
MESSTTPALAQPHRDALVAYYLGQLVPNEDSDAPDNIITPEDLYEYLLIDNQVGAEVDTSRVAQGIASVQQHVHAIYNGMEPGFGQLGDTAQHQHSQQQWQEAMSQYSTWAGYQMLVDYPENYLDPTLRLGKTETFQAFEGALGQARLTPDNVQKALGHYLTRFEEVSNLDTVCCYIDGENFRRADYYFIGRSPADPSQYYWRKAALDLDDGSTHVPPSAWTEWKKIDVKAAGTVTHVRAAVVAGRLHLVWLEQVRETLDADDKLIADSFIYRLNVSYLKTDGRWTAAICLDEKPLPSFATLETNGYVLVAAMDGRHYPEPKLVVALMKEGDTQKDDYKLYQVRTQHWKNVNLVASLESLERSLTNQLRGGPGGAQFRIMGADTDGNVWGVQQVAWNPGGENQEGALSRFLELEVTVCVPAKTMLMYCTTVCRTPWYFSEGAGGAPSNGKVGMWRNNPRAEYSVIFNGAARSPGVETAWVGKSGIPDTDWLCVGNPDSSTNIGYSEFDIVRKKRADVIPAFVKTDQGGLFLDLAGLALPKLRYVRLNTTFAGELVRKAERSLAGVLGWETQHTQEPPIPGSAAPANVDFNGANGLYFWEIFFHVPHLAAWRLYQSFDYSGAEQWLNYLFNPQVRVAPLFPPPDQVQWQPYWTSRPLAFADDPQRDVAAPVDPDAIAYGAPSHYRKAIFMLYVDNIIAMGDSLYRQVTRDALNEAKLHYVRALSLLGPLSKGRSISQWAPMTLEDAADYEEKTFSSFEASTFKGLQHDTPRGNEGAPWVRLIDAPWFRLPVNTRLLDLWDELDLRLSNLRHNLTLDGRAMTLALYEAPANPLDLLRAQLNGSSLSLRRLGAQGSIPPYRFAVLLPRARDAVEVLIRFGEQVRQAMEMRDRAEQETLQQGHVMELSAFVEQLDALAVEQAQRSLEVSVATKAQHQNQIDYYERLLARDVSQAERDADEMFGTAARSRVVAGEFRAMGHSAGTAPNTVTFPPGPVPVPVPGGWQWGGPAWAAASILEGKSLTSSDTAEAHLRSDAHARRRDEWTLLKDQAQHQLESVERQIEQHQIKISSAQIKRERSLMARAHAQSLYAFMENRATNAALHQWLLSQMSTLYFQAYDAVLSQCLAAEACWQYEIGEPQTSFVPLNAWVDNRHGFTAGESLSLGLLQMESAYLVRNERRLSLVKTVSLRRLLQGYQSEGGQQGWAAVVADLRSRGDIDFQLKPSLFDQDYPGHYLRQLAQMSVSLPGVLGPYENARLTLSQLSSSYLLKPDMGGSKYLYQQAQELEGQHDDVNPRYVLANPRVNQQVAISGDLESAGMLDARPGDERYLPFEGTGAVSSWSLSFPRHASARQQALFDGLQDIILHVRYYATDGGKPFAEQIKGLIPNAGNRPKPAARRKALPSS